MIFKSQRTYNNNRLVADIPFDAELIRNVKRDKEDCNILTFTYGLENVATYFPHTVSDAFFVAQFTYDNLYLSASVGIDANSSHFAIDSTIEYAVFLNDIEKTKFMMSVIRTIRP